MDHRVRVLGQTGGVEIEEVRWFWKFAKMFPAISSFNCHNSSWEVRKSATNYSVYLIIKQMLKDVK